MPGSDYTQLGLAGITLAILFFVVRYFVQAMQEKDKVNKELTDKFIEITRGTIESQNKLAEAIDQNTSASKSNTDKLSLLVLKALKKNGKS